MAIAYQPLTKAMCITLQTNLSFIRYTPGCAPNYDPRIY